MGEDWPTIKGLDMEDPWEKVSPRLRAWIFGISWEKISSRLTADQENINPRPGGLEVEDCREKICHPSIEGLDMKDCWEEEA